MRRFALVLTHNRPVELGRCLEAILPQADLTVVVDNASDPPVLLSQLPPPPQRHGIKLLRIPDQPPNLSKLWNAGFDAIAELATDVWEVAVLCDDAIAPPGWFDAVTAAMRERGCVAGCSHPDGRSMPPVVRTGPDSDLGGRMPGWAFVLAGEAGLRADENMAWWWTDTDLDFRARQAGGMVMVGGYPVPNLKPNDFLLTIPGLAEQAGADGEVFVTKWGYRPW